MLKLKLQYFGHMMRIANSLEKDPDAGKNWMQEEKGTTEDEMVGWHHWLNRHEFEETQEDSDGWTEKPGVLQFMGSERVGRDLATEQQQQAKSWTK